MLLMFQQIITRSIDIKMLSLELLLRQFHPGILLVAHICHIADSPVLIMCPFMSLTRDVHVLQLITVLPIIFLQVLEPEVGICITNS